MQGFSSRIDDSYCLSGGTTPNGLVTLSKELYILTGMETFAKEPEFLKLLRELKSTPARRYKKSPLVFVVCL